MKESLEKLTDIIFDGKIDINDFNVKHKSTDTYYFTTSDYRDFVDDNDNGR